MKRECENCIKYKTIYCSNSDECLIKNKVYYENEYTLLTKVGYLEQALKDYIGELKINIKENAKLNKKYENAVADYETTMVEKEQLNSLVNSCQEEIRQLKKQVKDKTEDYKRMKDNFDSKVDIITKIDTQQKEFIKYLKSYIDLLNDKPDILEETKKDILKEILQKYKEIIGVSDEKEN